ncbi:MAG TPA: hypothetical protein VHS81_04065 [Caulobacteraceae bacterium]|nr:hypothetical protein [Caulobacteraceae bacterium]
MHKTIAEAFSLDAKTLAEHDVEDRRKDITSRSPTLGRRVAARQRVLLSALVVDLGADTVAACRIENVSDFGARIKLAEPRYLPPTFWLIAVTSGLAYDATVIWRKDERLGVEVGPSIDLTAPTNKAERQLQQIWRMRR